MKNALKLTLLATVLCLQVPAHADSASHQAAAEKLLTVMKVENMYKPLFSQYKTMFTSQLTQYAKDPATKAKVEKHVAQITSILQSELTWSSIKQDFVNIYMKHYNENELTEMTKFYQTPVGQKTISIMPTISKESMQIAQERAKKLTPQIQKISMDLIKSLNAEKK
ncbi:DUF2059 domain-containing protein [Zooshikella harenae]|uniref:DUF2059 domain-containing protein n=1 Tax=Zooshikella harenae TaxID=2827238 RepID=A0ABS5ZG05_9GAMM|nr:DUF2059 domain-containing protein [Zooshikella harenae]MBU2712915.1 DUF2059 domain-containing protein [Zooshikella harenae]